MNLSELLTIIQPLTGHFEVRVDVDDAGGYDEKTIFIIHFASNGNTGRPVCQFSFFIDIDVALLNAELFQLSPLQLDTAEIITCLQRKAAVALPFLYPFSGAVTDYKKLAGVFHECRGHIAAKRFGC